MDNTRLSGRQSCPNSFVSRRGDFLFQRSWRRLRALTLSSQTTSRSSPKDITMSNYGPFFRDVISGNQRAVGGPQACNQRTLNVHPACTHRTPRTAGLARGGACWSASPEDAGARVGCRPRVWTRMCDCGVNAGRAGTGQVHGLKRSDGISTG